MVWGLAEAATTTCALCATKAHRCHRAAHRTGDAGDEGEGLLTLFDSVAFLENDVRNFLVGVVSLHFHTAPNFSFCLCCVKRGPVWNSNRTRSSRCATQASVPTAP